MSDLLKVLDMREEEQCKFLATYLINEQCVHDWQSIADILHGDTFPGRETILALLAFRLRDEARKTNLTAWHNAIYLVASHINDSPLSDYGGEVPSEIWQWAQHIILNQSEYSLAIIWIVAVLIAKEQKK